MIDMDYANVLICSKTHGELFDYKKALLRVYVDMEFYEHVRIETDNIRTQYNDSIEQIIFYKQYKSFTKNI